MLEVKGLTKRFGGVLAVDKVSFSVPKNSIVSLIGPNGAGKTTLFNLLSGVYSCDEGQIVFAGADITRDTPEKRATNGLARTFQNVRLFKNLSVIENVLIGGYGTAYEGPRKWGARMRQLHRRAEELLDWVGIPSALCGKLPSELSYGNQRRAEIARALATSPKLLILDEPTAGMVAEEAEQMIALVQKLREQGLTLLLIEHNMGVVNAVSEKLVVVNFGKKMAEGIPSEVMTNPDVITAYLGSED